MTDPTTTTAGTGYSYTGDAAGYSGDITYDFAAIDDVSAAIGTFEGTMDGMLADLYRDFTNLFANWEGQAQAACEDARAQWDRGASEIKGALGRVGAALGASGTDMRQLDATLAQRLGG